MLKQVQQDIIPYGSAYSNWAMLMQNFVEPFYEIVIVGKAVNEKFKELAQHYLPNAIFAGTSSLPTEASAQAGPALLPQEKGGTALPLLEGKLVEGKTLIYVCENKTCKLPTEDIQEALSLIAGPKQ